MRLRIMTLITLLLVTERLTAAPRCSAFRVRLRPAPEASSTVVQSSVVPSGVTPEDPAAAWTDDDPGRMTGVVRRALRWVSRRRPSRTQ